MDSTPINGQHHLRKSGSRGMFVPPQTSRSPHPWDPAPNRYSHARRHSDNVTIHRRSAALRRAAGHERRSSLGSNIDVDRQSTRNGRSQNSEFFLPRHSTPSHSQQQPREDYFLPRNGESSSQGRRQSGELPPTAALLLPRPSTIDDRYFGNNNNIGLPPNNNSHTFYVPPEWLPQPIVRHREPTRIPTQSRAPGPSHPTAISVGRQPRNHFITRVRLPQQAAPNGAESGTALIVRATNREGSMEAQPCSRQNSQNSSTQGTAPSSANPEDTIPHVGSDGRHLF